MSFLAAASAATLLLAAVRSQAASTDGAVAPVAPALAVSTVRVVPGDRLTTRQAFSGRVQARRSSVLGFDAAGRLAAVHVDEGDRVAPGEVLAELDTDRLDARRAELVAAAAEAEANLALADATLRRLRGVLEAGGVSRQGLDEAREGRRAARAALDLGRQRIATLDVEIARSRLPAPYAGTIVARLVDEGRVLAAGEAVVRLQDGAVPEIRIGVAGPLAGELHVGARYALQSRGGEVTARLRAVLPLRSTASRTVDALFDPVAPHPDLIPGDVVTLHLRRTVPEPGTWLPTQALAAGERGLWSIYIAEPADDAPRALDATHRVVRRSVDLVYQEADRVYVRGALGDRPRVLVEGLHRVVPGQWVRAVDAQPVAAQPHRDRMADG